MKNLLPVKFIIIVLAWALFGAAHAFAQTDKKNFGFSGNPKTKSKTSITEPKTETAPPVKPEIADNKTQTETTETLTAETPTVETPTIENPEFESRSVASKTLEVVKQANIKAVSPTEIYKVGIGDVLFISLQNAPAKASTYFTVLNDGKIDYPLAGEMLSVSGLTVEEIEDLLKEKIKLYENPQIAVKVREHASHQITVLGLVEKAGEKYLPREAVPLFMIRAEAIVQPRADTLIIKRADATTEQIDLRDEKSENVLIFPGDILEFKSSLGDVEASSATKQFYFIGGNINAGGQKDFHTGLTLTQAILASGGLKKNNVKRVVIRRKNQAGLLSPIEFDLNLIKDGKQPDPLINAGDTIEILN